MSTAVSNCKLQRTRTRLNNLLRSRRLWDSAMHLIVKNVEQFVRQQPEKLEDLPPLLQRDVLHALTNLKCTKIGGDNEFCEIIKSFLPILLCSYENNGTNTLILDNLLTFSSFLTTDDFLSEVLSDVVLYTAHLGSLTLRQEMTFGQISMETSTLASICRLEMLNKLELSAVCYGDVLMLCKSLEKLKHLDVTIVSSIREIEQDLDDFICTFGRLEVFLFRADTPCSHPNYRTSEEYLYAMCVKYLENIKIVMDVAESTRCGVPQLDFPARATQLEHLHASPEVKEWNSIFPNVKHLKIHFNSNEYDNDRLDAMTQFTSIKSLNLDVVPSLPITTRFLESYGAKLRTLVLSSRPGNDMELNLSSIFINCPHIEKLHLFITSKFTDEDKSKFPRYPSLKEFIWEPKSRGAALSNIVKAATCLEKLTLLSGNFDVNDLSSLTSLVEKKEILRELRCFHFDLFSENSTQTRRLTFDSNLKLLLSALSDFLWKVSVHLPKLFNVELMPLSLCIRGKSGIKISKTFDSRSNRCLYELDNLTTLGYPDLARLIEVYRIVGLS